MKATWDINDLVRLHLPPENAESCDEQEAPDSDMEEAYIEPPPPSEGGEESKSGESDEESQSDSEDESKDESTEPKAESKDDGKGEEEGDSAGSEDGSDDGADGEASGSETSDDSSDGSGESSSDGDSGAEESGSSEDSESESASGHQRPEESENSDPKQPSSADDSDDDPADEPEGRDGDAESGDKRDDRGEEDGGDSEDDIKFEEEEIVSEEDKKDGMTPEQRKKLRDSLKDVLESIDRGTMEDKHLAAKSDEILDKLNTSIKNDVYAVGPKVEENVYCVQDTESNRRIAKDLEAPSLAMLGTLGNRLRYLFQSRESQAILGGMTKGPRIDGRNIHKAVTGKKGRTPPIFSKKQRSKNEDAVVSILVDNSGSMSDGVKDKITEKMCIGLGLTLQRMNTPFEMFGFTARDCGSFRGTTRVSPVMINSIKRFEEKFEPYRALFKIPTRQNADLEVGKIMVERLKERPEPKKIYFVISDGEPYSNMSGYDSLYRRFLEATRAQGIHVFGFGIGVRAGVEDYFGDDYAIIHERNLDTFPGEVIEVLTRILGRS